MRAWRIHFGWAIVTVLAIAISARVASHRVEGEAPAPRDRAVPPPEGASAIPVRFRTEPLPGDAPSPPAPPPPAAGESQAAEKIRALIPKSQNWGEFQEAMKDVTDRDLRLTLAKEALASTNMTAVYWAMSVLGELKGRDAAEPLESFLKMHRDVESAQSAASWLGEMGDPGSLTPLLDALHSKREEVHDASAAALMKLGYRAPAEELMAKLATQYESPDGSLRRDAIERMGELDAGSAIPLLARALGDSNGDVRLAALSAFSNVESAGYVALLEPLMSDPNPRVSQKARDLVEALKGIEK